MRPSTLILLVVALLLIAVAQPAVADAPAVPPVATAAAPSGPNAPDAFYTGINAGCYVAGPSNCRIHIDPLTLHVADASRLVAYRILANNKVIYDFRTDKDKGQAPPSGTTLYTPSLVTEDFAAVCGATYRLNLYVRDTSMTDLGLAGETDPFTCPDSPPTAQFMPGIWSPASAAGLLLAAMAGMVVVGRKLRK